MTSQAPAPIRDLILTMPAYNEAESIGELLDRAVAAFEKLEGINWHIIAVNDGSADETAEIVRAAASREPRIHLANHEVNRGLGPAILTGLNAAAELAPPENSMVVCMDADLTHAPELVPEMLRVINGGADLVIASRYQPGSKMVGVNAMRTLFSFGARHVFQFALGLPGVRDYTCGFRAIRTSLIMKGFQRFGRDGLIVRRGFACTDELLIKLALFNPVIREIPFILRYDEKRGASKINLGVTIMETLRLVGWARRELKAARRANPK